MSERKNFNRNSVISNAIIFLVLILTTSFLLPLGKTFKYTDFKVGHIAPETVVAPYGYEVLKTDEELEKDRNDIKHNILPVYDYLDTLNNTLYYKYRNFLVDLKKLKESETDLKKLMEERNSLIHTNDSIYQENKIELANEYHTTDSIYQLARKNVKQEQINFKNKYNIEYESLTDALLDRKLQKEILYYLKINRKIPILDTPKSGIFNHNLEKIVSKSKNSIDTLDLADFKDYNDININNINYLLKYFPEQDNDSLLVWNKIVKNFLKPNVVFNKKITMQIADSIMNAVPLAKGIVRNGEILVEKDQVISKEVYEKLLSLEKKEEEIFQKSKENSLLNRVFLASLFGNFINSFLPFFILFISLLVNRTYIFYDLRKMILLATLVLIQLLINYFLRKYFDNYNEFLIPLCSLSMLTAILFDVRTAFLTTATTALAVAMIMGSSFNYFYIPFIPAIISIYAVRKIRDRFQQFFRPFIYMSTSYTLLFVSFVLVSGNTENLKSNMIYALITSLVVPIITFVLVVIIELVFKTATEITLLELTDMTKPLLKKLQMESPGTYHHSMVVGNLAEAAAEAIGANSLLARVGAYYHDIGKTFRPDYFVENQQNKENRHDKIPPNMSSLIIINHVKEGVKLAREHKLPEIIIDFIKMHHGTSRIEFFYHKAKKQAETSGEKVEDSSYRYPGPKPQTKETAILMIADVVEARVRTIEKPDFDSYRHAINEIIKKKFQDGDLEECDLKFSDLTKIREAMLPVIMGMYHSRIKYPDQEKKTKKDSKDSRSEIDKDKKEEPTILNQTDSNINPKDSKEETENSTKEKALSKEIEENNDQ